MQEKITDTTLSLLRERGNERIVEGRFKNTGFAMSGLTIGQHQSYNPFEYVAVARKKDGTDAKPKTKTVSLYHSYCPFCGIKYE